jgi:N-methylhydantoinase A
VLGRIDPDRFAGGSIQLDASLSRQALDTHVGAKLDLDTTLSAFGVSEVVEENMANAARVHAVERGAELEGRTLIAFGGGAPLHAARLAEKLGIADVLIPASAGVGSAGRLPARADRLRGCAQPLRASLGLRSAAINAMFGEMAKEATEWSSSAPVPPRSGSAAAPTCAMRAKATRSWSSCRTGRSRRRRWPSCRSASTPDTAPCSIGDPRARHRVVGWILKAEAPAPGRAEELLPDAAPGPPHEMSGSGDPRSGDKKPFRPNAARIRHGPVYARAALKPGQSIQVPAVNRRGRDHHDHHLGFTATLDPSGAIRLLARKAVLQEAAQ